VPALSISIGASDLSGRMQDRLRGLNAAKPNTIVWQQGANQVAIFIDSLKARLLDGWLICNLDMQSDATGRQTLQIVFFLGKAGDASGTNAASTVNAPTLQAAQLANQWGDELHRVLWDAVLDAVEAALFQLEARSTAGPFTLQGFRGAVDLLEVDVIAGGA
jgi:hypothetical protein